ncbi:MAG: hypothetical protein AB7F98_18375 [Novosphingobium sp.]
MGEMAQIDAARDVEVERKALAWMEDPFGAFGHSVTAIHSVPREEAEAVQLAGLNLRLAQRRDQIQTLAKFVDAQGIGTIDTLDDGARVLFNHDVYKSYPVSLLAKSRFDQLTKWLDRLTPYDLSGLDVSACQSIDDWLVFLRDNTGLDVATSSGTSGTMSFFPRSKQDYWIAATAIKVQLLQKFGEPVDWEAFEAPRHALTPFYNDGHSTVARIPVYFKELFCKGDDSLLHTALPFKASADLMWLAARVRAAQAMGDGGKVDVPDSLLARKGEWEELNQKIPQMQASFIRKLIPELAGERVIALGITAMFFEIARDGLALGAKAAFAPGSAVMGGGGGKGIVLPDDYEQVICTFFGVERLNDGYGMTEQNGFMVSCEAGRFHVAPWATLFLLDPETGAVLPREGEQAGRAAFFDMTHDGSWGGIVSGDRIEASYQPCECGRSTIHLSRKIQRFSELGGDDKITCAATPSAQADALDFLTRL